MSKDAQNREFHDARRTGVGGSDVGVLLGMNDYKTPYQLWEEKTGRAEPFEGNLQTRFGNWAEQFVADEWCLRTGRKVQRFNGTLRHPTAPLIGHVDRLVVPPGSKIASHRGKVKTNEGLECKTAHALASSGDNWGESGTDHVPESYLLQCAAYMAVTGCGIWHLACLFGNSDFRTYIIERDMELEARIIEDVTEWWNKHVVADVPPDPQSELEARRKWASHDPGKVLSLDDGGVHIFHRYAALKANIREMEKEEQELRNMIIPLISDAEAVEYEGKKIATYKTNKPSMSTDWRSLALELLEDYDESERESRIDGATMLKPGSRVLRLNKAVQCLDSLPESSTDAIKGKISRRSSARFGAPKTNPNEVSTFEESLIRAARVARTNQDRASILDAMSGIDPETRSRVVLAFPE